MTTIVYRDGVLAADSRAYSGDKHPMGRKVKIHRLADGSLFGASSSKVGMVDKIRRLVEEHGVEATFPSAVDAQALLIKPDGRIYYFSDQDGFSGPIDADYLSIGSGDQYAMGALKMGADAVRAVEISCECDVWSGLPVVALRLGADHA